MAAAAHKIEAADLTLLVRFGGDVVHLVFDGKPVITLPRDQEAGEADANVQFLRAVATGTGTLAALRRALPYVQKVAATAPTEPERMQRQRQAVIDLSTVNAAIAYAEGR